MAALTYDVPFAAIALTGTTAKSVVGFLAPANQALLLKEIAISFDGSDSTKVAALVELCRCTFATNAPGTNSTSATGQKHDPGRSETIQATLASNWTTEPTVITVKRPLLVPQYNGQYHVIRPEKGPILIPGGAGLVLRVTSPNNVNCTGFLTVEE